MNELCPRKVHSVLFYLFHSYTHVEAWSQLGLMSNGSLVSYGYRKHQRAVVHYNIYKLCQHNLKTERLIYSKCMFISGAIEITFDDKPTLLLSDGWEEFFWIAVLSILTVSTMTFFTQLLIHRKILLSHSVNKQCPWIHFPLL